MPNRIPTRKNIFSFGINRGEFLVVCWWNRGIGKSKSLILFENTD